MSKTKGVKTRGQRPCLSCKPQCQVPCSVHNNVARVLSSKKSSTLEDRRCQTRACQSKGCASSCATTVFQIKRRFHFHGFSTSWVTTSTLHHSSLLLFCFIPFFFSFFLSSRRLAFSILSVSNLQMGACPRPFPVCGPRTPYLSTYLLATRPTASAPLHIRKGLVLC